MYGCYNNVCKIILLKIKKRLKPFVVASMNVMNVGVFYY